MKLLKLLAPAGLVALLTMAILAPSAAMGESTVLCEADEDPCDKANVATTVHYEGDVNILTSIMDYTCDVLISMSALALAAPQVLHGYASYTNCNEDCERTELSDGFLLEVLRTGEELAEVAGKGLRVLALCEGGLLHCVFTLEGITGHLTGPLATGGDGALTYEESELHRESGFLCPEEAKLDAEFEPSAPLYVKS